MEAIFWRSIRNAWVVGSNPISGSILATVGSARGGVRGDLYACPAARVVARGGVPIQLGGVERRGEDGAAADASRGATADAHEHAHGLEPWLRARGWQLFPHQREVLRIARDRSCVVVAPTGGGKTLCGFLPVLAELDHADPVPGLQALYLSPLKALTADVHRNLLGPLEEIGSSVRCEVRTGDTSAHRRRAQRERPPHLLLSTPESLALLLSHADASRTFGRLRYLILDEIHALADNKRGDLLALQVARLRRLRPELRVIGLSATVADPAQLQQWLRPEDPDAVAVIDAERYGVRFRPPRIELYCPEDRLPWAGHGATHAVPAIAARIRAHRSTLVFVNTRGQAERLYQQLVEELASAPDPPPIGLHHGSLEKEDRLRAEAAMARGEWRALVATSSLDLGIDWGEVDLVIQAGPPKGVARLLQRLGRSRHRLEEASQALVIPAQAMEAVEAVAAIAKVRAHQPDNDLRREGSLDVLVQFLIGRLASAPATRAELWEEVTSAGPYAALTREDFAEVLAFSRDGGYALGAYPDFQRIREDEEGCLSLRDARVARQHRMNIGTIVGYPLLRVQVGRGKGIGEVEERFVQQLRPGQCFRFAGRVLRFEGIRDGTVKTSPARSTAAVIPAFAGGRLPLSASLAREVRAILADRARWDSLPAQVERWLRKQAERSAVPGWDEWLVETFPRAGRYYLVIHPFAGRAAHQTLGLLLSRRLESLGAEPTAFVANDYAVAVQSLQDPLPTEDPSTLLSPDILEAEVEEWMADSYLLKRTFREVALVSGLIDRTYPGRKKTGRQVTFSSDLIYEVLRRYEPHHFLLRTTEREARRGLVAWDRLAEELRAVDNRYRLQRLDRVSPFAVAPVLEVGQEPVDGSALDRLLDLREEEVLAEAGLTEGPAA